MIKTSALHKTWDYLLFLIIDRFKQRVPEQKWLLWSRDYSRISKTCVGLSQLPDDTQPGKLFATISCDLFFCSRSCMRSKSKKFAFKPLRLYRTLAWGASTYQSHRHNKLFMYLYLFNFRLTSLFLSSFFLFFFLTHFLGNSNCKITQAGHKRYQGTNDFRVMM